MGFSRGLKFAELDKRVEKKVCAVGNGEGHERKGERWEDGVGAVSSRSGSASR